MKKILALLIVLCLLASCLVACDSGARYDDAKALIEEGKYEEAYAILADLGDYKDAKELLANFYYAPVSGEYIEDGEALTVEFLYDENNLLIRTVKTTADGGKYIVDYTYDANHDLIKETYSGLDVGEAVYTYDAERRLIKEAYVDAKEGSSSSHEYTYDADGNRLTEVYVDGDGDDGYTMVDTYENGVWVGSVAIYEDGVRYESVCTYDAKGNLIKEEFEGTDGIIGSYAYTYDENGNLLEERDVYSDGWEETYTYTYDADGNVLTASGVYSDGYEYSYVYTYDENGNRVKIVYTDSDGAAETKEVEYKLVYIPFSISYIVEGYLSLEYVY